MKISDNGYDMTNKIDEALKIKIKDEFIHGYVDENGVRRYPTIVALSKRHSVANVSLHRRSKSEDWQSDKNKVQTQYEEAVKKERIEKMVAYGAQLDDNSINLALAVMGDAGRRINEDLANRSKFEKISKMPDGPDKDAAMRDFRLFHKILSPHDMTSIANSVSNAQKIGKLALGQAQEISKVSANVSAPDRLREIISELDELAGIKASRAKHIIQ